MKLSVKYDGILTTVIWILLMVFFPLKHLNAQELEPRNLANIPVGTNFVIAGYSYGMGNLLLDPSIPIENLNANLHTMVGAYVRSLNMFGLSSKLDVILPFAAGNWGGQVTGIDSSTSRIGFGDVRVRLSVNFIGAPALKSSQYGNYDQKTIIGFNIQFILPTGQYYSQKLINLGSNRFTLKPQIGISQKVGKWILEAYSTAWIFFENSDFYGGNRLSQRTLWSIKSHFIRTLPRGMWVAGSLGYGRGGRTEINELWRDTRMSTLRIGLLYVLPLKEKHSLRFSAQSGIRFEKGPDFDAFGIAYQYRWGGND